MEYEDNVVFALEALELIVVVVAILSPLALSEVLDDDDDDVVVKNVSSGLRMCTLKQIRLKCSHI